MNKLRSIVGIEDEANLESTVRVYQTRTLALPPFSSSASSSRLSKARFLNLYYKVVRKADFDAEGNEVRLISYIKKLIKSLAYAFDVTFYNQEVMSRSL